VLSVAEGAGSKPEDPESRRLGGYLMFCSMASLAVSSALWMPATSSNPIAVHIVQQAGLEIDFGKWLLASAVPSLVAIALLPLIVAKIFPPRVGKTPEAPRRRARSWRAWAGCRARSGFRPGPLC
jgi:DASS family divalent anion:Na+ symporter